MASSSGVEKNALNTSGAASGQSGQAYGALAPTLTTMATHPIGYTPQQKADMLTASEQSTGGSVAGAVGQGALQAARTNNAGGNALALDDAARQGLVTNSINALGVENQDAQLKQQQQQEGLSGLENIYNGANGTNVNALGVAQRAEEAANAWKSQLIGAAGQVGGGWAGGGFKR